MEIEQMISQHAYNLIQNFYIIGIERKNDTLVSSILSRYPLVDIPYIKISDEVIINVSEFKYNNIALLS
jgi:hypothetical protein